MLANPSAKFKRPCVHVTLAAKPYERRSICILPARQADGVIHSGMSARCSGGGHAHYTRSRVVEAVERGEMRWLDRFHNVATFTMAAAGTWQKQRSGPVATMQLVVGAKGRYVPVIQRDPEYVIPELAC